MCTAACIQEGSERCWPTEATSDWDLVWHTADRCQWGDWRWEMLFPGLCPCRGTSCWTFVVISTVACLLLTFSCRMAKHVTTVVVSCSSKCRCPFFLTHIVNACYEISLTWYPISSKLAIYICEHWRLIVYAVYQKLWILISICWSYLKILQWSVFLNHSVVPYITIQICFISFLAGKNVSEMTYFVSGGM